jgi:hypothetical protein
MRTGRPVCPTSERQLRPWELARVSKAAFYRAKATLKAAGVGNTELVDIRSMMDLAPQLRATSRASGLSLPDTLAHFKRNLGLDLSRPPLSYTTFREAQAQDRLKSGRLHAASTRCKVSETKIVDDAGVVLQVVRHRRGE